MTHPPCKIELEKRKKRAKTDGRDKVAAIRVGFADAGYLSTAFIRL